MYLKVRDETVRKNVEIFKIILKRSSHSVESLKREQKAQDFKAFVHRLSGEVRFVDLSSDPVDSREWVIVSFLLSLPSKDGESISFEVSGKEGFLFSWDGLQPEAIGILKETVKTIQLMAKFLPRIQSLSGTFREFSQINLDSFLDEIPTRDLIHEAWCQISREKCEAILLHKDQGTFLFRQDEFASILEDQLIRCHKRSIKCITLTYVDTFQKVVDFTLVKKKEGWIVYDNDPCLIGPLYPTVKALLDRFKLSLKTPLLNV